MMRLINTFVDLDMVLGSSDEDGNVDGRGEVFSHGQATQ